MRQTTWLDRPWALSVVWGLATLIFAWCILAPNLGNDLVTDGCAQWLLAESLGTDHPYRVDAVRDFYLPSTTLPVPSRSFPPLYPLLIAAWNALFATKMYSGIWINFLILPAISILSLAITRRLTGRSGSFSGGLVIVVLLIDPHFRTETAGGSALPWQYFLTLVTVYCGILATEEGRMRSNFLLGLSVGLLALLRFDQSLYALAVTLMFALREYRAKSFRRALKVGVVISTGIGLVYLPWCIRNTIVFGIPFASDNSITVVSLAQKPVMISAFPDFRPPNFTDGPFEWVEMRWQFLVANVNRWVRVYPGSVVVICLLAVLWVQAGSRLGTQLKWSLRILFTNGICSLFALSLTPFDIERYYSILHFNSLVGFALVLDRLLEVEENGKSVRRTLAFLVPAFFFCAFVHGSNLYHMVRLQSFRYSLIPQDESHRISHYETIIQETGLRREEVQLLAIQGDWTPPVLEAESFRTLTGVPTIFVPINVYGQNKAFAHWHDRWQPDYYLVNKQWAIAMKLTDCVIGRSKHWVLLDGKKVNQMIFPGLR